MPGRVHIRGEVPNDLRDVVRYFAQQGRISAPEVSNAFYATVDELNLMPGMPGIGHFSFHRSRRLRDIRAWQIPGLPKILIFYRTDADGLDVLAVFHGSRNIPSLLLRRLKNSP
jgi:plasmid stabilization system protein ParE